MTRVDPCGVPPRTKGRLQPAGGASGSAGGLAPAAVGRRWQRHGWWHSSDCRQWWRRRCQLRCSRDSSSLAPDSHHRWRLTPLHRLASAPGSTHHHCRLVHLPPSPNRWPLLPAPPTIAAYSSTYRSIGHIVDGDGTVYGILHVVFSSLCSQSPEGWRWPHILGVWMGAAKQTGGSET